MSPLLCTHFWRKIKEVVKKVKKIGRWKPPYYQKFEDEWFIIGTTLHPIRIKYIIKGILIVPIKIWKTIKGISYRRFKDIITIRGLLLQSFSIDFLLRGTFLSKIKEELLTKGKKTFRRMFEILFEDE